MNDVRVNLPGYVPEKRGGRILHRVRVEGDKRKRITIPVGPESPSFSEHYHAARMGEVLDTVPPERIAPGRRTLSAMIEGYLAQLDRDVTAGSMSALTLKQRRSVLGRVAAMPDETGARKMGEYHCDLPVQAMLHIQDEWGAATSQADTSIKSLRAAYEWAMRRRWVAHNPAAGVKSVHKGRGGATPWRPQDIKAFLKVHPVGTAAHTWIMLALWTGARLGDLHQLGRGDERIIAGALWLEWQPAKKGSAPVALPMAPQLVEATRAGPVIGRTYILSEHGRPFGSGPSLAERVRKWTATAGLTRRSSHGLRKAMGALLAEAGATEHQIMSVMAHTKPTTSAIYTKSAQRAQMAAQAMATMQGVRIG